jgi:hypothetical protein
MAVLGVGSGDRPRGSEEKGVVIDVVGIHD